MQTKCEEIQDWQAHRLIIATDALVIVAGVLSLDLYNDGAPVPPWHVLSSLLVMFLTIASVLTWYCATVNVKMAEHLKSLHNNSDTNDPSTPATCEWRLGILGEHSDSSLHVNQLLAILYLALGVFAIAIPFRASGNFAHELAHPWVIIATVLLVISNVPNLFRFFLRAYHRENAKKPVNMMTQHDAG